MSVNKLGTNNTNTFGTSSVDRSKYKCYLCGERGHIKKFCKKNPNSRAHIKRIEYFKHENTYDYLDNEFIDDEFIDDEQDSTLWFSSDRLQSLSCILPNKTNITRFELIILLRRSEIGLKPGTIDVETKEKLDDDGTDK